MLTLLGLLTALATAPDSLTFSGRDGNLDVRPPRLVAPDLALDGNLDEPSWQQAALLSDFTQYEPVEGVIPDEATEVRVFYTDDAIYFGIRALDADPRLVQAHLGERDRSVFGDDWVRIMLDTYDDRRQAYVFYVNPLGIQTDGLWIEGYQGRGGGSGGGSGGSGGVSIDFNPDFIWDSDGHVNQEGWSAELRIPFVSIRFREVPEQSWGIHVAREVKRKGFKQSWAPLTKEVSSTLAQSGRLVGLRDLHPRRLVEVNPVLTGTRTGTNESGRFLRSDPRGDFGVNGRLGVTQNLVLDGTYNPDFSQVEADANQIRVNERFALFFPEKRAFFLEGSEIFNTPARLVYTRQIVDPVAGAKLTGKVGSFQVGYIGALDESPSTILGASGQALFNVVRARRDVGSASTVGLLYTDRSLTDGSGAYNRLVAGDARLVFGGRYTLTTQVAGSATRDPDAGEHDGLRPLLKLDFERGGRSFSWNASLVDIHPDFRASSGFITRAGDTEANAGLSLTHYGAPGSILERVSLRVLTNNYFRHDGFWSGRLPFEHETELFPTLFLRGDRSLTLVLRRGYFRFQPKDYVQYEVQTEDGRVPFVTPGPVGNLLAWGLMPRLRITNNLNVNGSAYFREVPIYDEAARGWELRVGPSLDYRPTDALQLQVNYTYSRISRRSRQVVDGSDIENRSVFSTVKIPRVRAQYQFSRSLFARAVLQYELGRSSALVDPRTGAPLLLDGEVVAAAESGEFLGQVLFQYQPGPGTIFYIGFSRLMEGGRTYRLASMSPVEEGLFVKLSYLFRK